MTEREYSGLGEWGKRHGVSRTDPFEGRRINVVADTPSSEMPLATTRGILAQALLGSDLIDRLLDYAKTGEDRQQLAWSWANRIVDWLEKRDGLWPADPSSKNLGL